MPAASALTSMPNATMFDFGGGMNFNPMPNGGTMGTGPNAVPNIAPTFGVPQPRMAGIDISGFGVSSNNDFSLQGTVGTPSTVPGGDTSGSGGPNGNGNLLGWNSPVQTGGSGNPSLTSGTLPFYTGAGSVSGNLSQIFGPLGPYILNAIQTGGYNPAVFDALVAQLQPQVDRGVATIGANAGANGTRFGSGYDLALGDYLSQVNLNETSMAAGLYENAVQNSFGLLGQVAGDTSQYQSNKGGFTSSLISSLIRSLGPTLLNKIPGLSSSNSGSNNGGLNTVPTFPDSGMGVSTFGTSLGLPGTVGTPNASDPFGNNTIPTS